MVLAGAGIENGIRWMLNAMIGKRVIIRSTKAYMLFIASLGNALSDYLGGLSAGSVTMANGTFLGCIIISIICIPFVYRITKRNIK